MPDYYIPVAIASGVAVIVLLWALGWFVVCAVGRKPTTDQGQKENAGDENTETPIATPQ